MKLLFGLLLLLTLSTSKILACTASYQQMYIKDEYYNFIDPSMVSLNPNNPLYTLANSELAHQERFDYFSKKRQEANIKAWGTYFQGELSEKEIHTIFYKKDSIKTHAKFYENSSKYPNFAKYINFLHLQNKIAQNHSQKDSQKIIDQGLKLFYEEEQPFLKERYLYLLMRLYHHTGQYYNVEEIYVNNVLTVNPKGIVTEWIDALRAGAFQHRKQAVKANQLYGKIFQYHKTNAHYGYYDFKINHDQEWNTLLKSTENNQTKAVYHFLRALKWEGEALYELEAIAKIAPNSIWFERLAYMILQELQHKRYDIMVYSGKKGKEFKSKVKNYKLKKEYYLKIINSLKSHTFFTLYSKLYLNVLEYNSLKRKELVQLASLANHKQKPYADLLNYIYGLHQLSTNSASEQFILYTQLKPLLPKFSESKQASILRYTALQLSTLNGQNTIEQTINKLFAENKDYRSTILKALNHADAEKFQAYIEHQKRAFFEEKIFKETMKSLHKGDVAKILATLYLQEDNFSQAQLYLRQVPQENVYNHYNPFNTTISANNRSPGQTNYSQRKFVETMLRLESVLEKNPTSARDHFLYANGLYNKSWFGNFPMSSVLHRSPTLLKGKALPKTTNLSKAQQQYELALQYATKEEFRAKIAYQLLKIKFHNTLSNTQNYNHNLSIMPHFTRENNGTSQVIHLLQNSKDFTEAIKDFRADYEHTKFAQEVIEKCITFRYF
jgi:hypothetical protein